MVKALPKSGLKQKTFNLDLEMGQIMKETAVEWIAL